jgi:hypothetical protein
MRRVFSLDGIDSSFIALVVNLNSVAQVNAPTTLRSNPGAQLRCATHFGKPKWHWVQVTSVILRKDRGMMHSFFGGTAPNPCCVRNGVLGIAIQCGRLLHVRSAMSLHCPVFGRTTCLYFVRDHEFPSAATPSEPSSTIGLSRNPRSHVSC